MHDPAHHCDCPACCTQRARIADRTRETECARCHGPLGTDFYGTYAYVCAACAGELGMVPAARGLPSAVAQPAEYEPQPMRRFWREQMPEHKVK